MKRVFTVLFCLFSAGTGKLTAQSPDISIGGYADTLHAVPAAFSGQMTDSRTEVLGEIRAGSGGSSLLIQTLVTCSQLTPSANGIQLREAYFEYSADNFDLRTGRQIIAWGKADGIAITDIICPRDLSSFAGNNYSDSRLPADAVRFRQFSDVYLFELEWLPVFTPAMLPDERDNPLFETAFPSHVDTDGYSFPVAYKDAERPDTFADGEYAARLSLFLPVMDFSIAAFSGMEDLPRYRKTMQTDPQTGEPSGISVSPDYYRIWMTGFDAAFPVDAVIIRAEGALFGGRYFDRDGLDDPSKRNQLKLLAGIDWTPSGLTLTAQLADDYVTGRRNGLERETHEPAATLSLSKTFFRELLEISLSRYQGIAHGDSCTSIDMDYAATDALHFYAGGEFFGEGSDTTGEFAAYKDLSCIYLKGKYSF